jgi:sortase A
MKRKKYADELTEDELRLRLMQKKMIGRDARIASYRASGRVVDAQNAPINAELSWNPDKGISESDVKAPPKKRFDKILLSIELLAVAGVIVMLLIGTQILQNINRESAKSMILPTLTPTALIQAVVLPGGHTPPDASGVGQFNESEIPEHLRGIVSVVPEKPVLAPGTEQIVRLRIPAINVDAPVVQGDDWESLKLGVGLNHFSPLPGQPGNVVLSGHNDIFGQVFRDLDQLKPGDEIIVLTEKNAYTYNVQNTEVVLPHQVEVMAQTTDETITLISCYPYLVDDKRIIIKGKIL